MNILTLYKAAVTKLRYKAAVTLLKIVKIGYQRYYNQFMGNHHIDKPNHLGSYPYKMSYILHHP
jgi:hypothetical protein